MTWEDIHDTSESPFFEMGKIVEINGVRMREGIFCRYDEEGFFRGLWTQDGNLAPGEIYVRYLGERDTDGNKTSPSMTVYRSSMIPLGLRKLRDYYSEITLGSLLSSHYQSKIVKIPLSIEYFEDKADEIFSIKDTKPIKFARQISDLKSELNFLTQYILDIEKFENTFEWSGCSYYLDEVWFRRIEQIKMSVYSNISNESENDPNYG